MRPDCKVRGWARRYRETLSDKLPGATVKESLTVQNEGSRRVFTRKEERIMLKVWGRRNSFNVQKVMWLAGELGLAHEHISVGGKFGGLGTPKFLAMNPHGRIPVINDSGIVVWESHTILRYLAARNGKAPFWSDDPGVHGSRR